MGYGQDVLKRMKLISFVVANSMGVASIDIQTLEVDRGVSWEQAMEKRSLLVGPHEGFNICRSRFFTLSYSLFFMFIRIFFGFFLKNKTSPAKKTM